DTFTEGYHVGALHPQTIGAMFVGGVNSMIHYGKNHEFAFASHQFLAALNVTKPEAEELEGSTARIIFVFPNIILSFMPLSPTEQVIGIYRVFPGEAIDQAYAMMASYKFGG